MKCPNCNVSLVMTERSGVEIDYCPDCRGVWLDRGELDKIIERAAQNTGSMERDHYPDPKRHYADKEHYKKKRKGILDELFDF
jgi:Zn-finger nucleic acid-binding protein